MPPGADGRIPTPDPMPPPRGDDADIPARGPGRTPTAPDIDGPPSDIEERLNDGRTEVIVEG
jgi:hypothetical protein